MRYLGLTGLFALLRQEKAAGAWEGSLRLRGLHSLKTFAKLVLSQFDEAQGCRVHAVAEAGRPRPIVEDVTEVGVARPAGDCGALYAEGTVGCFDDVLFCDWLPEARPAGAGVELGL